MRRSFIDGVFSIDRHILTDRLDVDRHSGQTYCCDGHLLTDYLLFNNSNVNFGQTYFGDRHFWTEIPQNILFKH